MTLPAMTCCSATNGAARPAAPRRCRRTVPCRCSRSRRRTPAASRRAAGTHRTTARPEPRKVMSIVPGASPSGPYRRVTSEPSIVPTVRLTLRTCSSSRTGAPSSSAPSHSWMSVLSSAASRPWSCSRDLGQRLLVRVGRGVQHRREVEAVRLPVLDRLGACRAGRPGRSPRPACGSRARRAVRAPAAAMNSKNVSTNSGLPVNRSRSTGFCVATPTGQVSRWQTRIMMQPERSAAPSRSRTPRRRAARRRRRRVRSSSRRRPAR